MFYPSNRIFSIHSLLSSFLISQILLRSFLTSCYTFLTYQRTKPFYKKYEVRHRTLYIVFNTTKKQSLPTSSLTADLQTLFHLFKLSSITHTAFASIKKLTYQISYASFLPFRIISEYYLTLFSF